MDFFEACCSNFAYRELQGQKNGPAMQKLYDEIKKLLRSYYEKPIDMTSFFYDPQNKKHCWYKETVSFKKYGLTWNEASQSVYAVYADCPLLFFVDTYKVGGYPEQGTITPVLDGEFCRGDFRSFYAKKVQETLEKQLASTKFKRGMREKAKAMYLLIQKNATYNKNKGEFANFVDTPSHSVFGYVRDKAAVCEGFSRTYQAMMNYLGISAVTITGATFDNGNSSKITGYHARNMIYLQDEKKWIMVDVTAGVSAQSEAFFNLAKPLDGFRKMTIDERNGKGGYFCEPYAYGPHYDDLWSML